MDSEGFHSQTSMSVAASRARSARRKKMNGKKKPKTNTNNSIFGVSTDEMKHLVDAATTRVRAIEASRGQRLNDEEIVYIVKDLVCGQDNDDSMSATTAHTEQSRPPLTIDPSIRPVFISMLTFLLQQRLVTPGPGPAPGFVPTKMSNESAGIPVFEVISAPVNDLSSTLPPSPAKSTKSFASVLSSNTSMHDLRHLSFNSDAPQDDKPFGVPEKMMAHEHEIEHTVDELYATIAKLKADMKDDFDDHSSLLTAHTVDLSVDVEVEPNPLEDMVDCLLRYFDSGMGLEPQTENFTLMNNEEEFMTDDENDDKSVDEPVPVVTPTSSKSIFSTIFGFSEDQDSTPPCNRNVSRPNQPAGDKLSEEYEEGDEHSNGTTTVADDEEAGSAEYENDDEVPDISQPFFFGFFHASSADKAEILDESTIAEMDETFESVGDDGTLYSLNCGESASGIPFVADVTIGMMHSPEFPAASSETGDNFHNISGHNEDCPSDEEIEFIPCVVANDMVVSRAMSKANKIVAHVAAHYAHPSNHMAKPRVFDVGEAVQPSTCTDPNDSNEPAWDQLEVTTLPVGHVSPKITFGTPTLLGALSVSGAEQNENSPQDVPSSCRIRDGDESEGEFVLPQTINSSNESFESSDRRFAATKVMVLSTAGAVKTENLVSPGQAYLEYTGSTNLNDSTEGAWDRLEYTVQDLEEAAEKNTARKNKSDRIRLSQKKILDAGRMARKNLTTTKYAIDDNKENVDPMGSNKTPVCISPTLVRNMPMPHKESIFEGETPHSTAHADARRRRRRQRKSQSFVHPDATCGKTEAIDASKQHCLHVTSPQASELSYTLEEDEAKAMAELSFEKSTNCSDSNTEYYNQVLENIGKIVSEKTTEVRTHNSTEQIDSIDATQSARFRTQTAATRYIIKKVSVERQPLKPGCPESQWPSFAENATDLQTAKDLLCHKARAMHSSTKELMSYEKIFHNKEGLVKGEDAPGEYLVACDKAESENIHFVPHKPPFQRVCHKHVEGKNSPSASRLVPRKWSPSGQSSVQPECTG